MEKISHLICGKPLWQARPTFLTKHRKVGGEYIKEERGEIEERKSTAQGAVLKLHNHSADTSYNDTFSEEVSLCLVDAKPPSRST
jgi:hypothetical protein